MPPNLFALHFYPLLFLPLAFFTLPPSLPATLAHRFTHLARLAPRAQLLLTPLIFDRIPPIDSTHHKGLA